VKDVLQKMADALINIKPFQAENISMVVKEIIASSGIKMGVIMPIIRAALTGSIQGPDVFEISAILGPERTIERITKMTGWPIK
jgi:glutamyl-tRNA synthetase